MSYFKFSGFFIIVCMFSYGCAIHSPQFVDICNPIVFSSNTGANPAISMDTIGVFNAIKGTSFWQGGGPIPDMITYYGSAINNLQFEAANAFQGDSSRAIIGLRYETKNYISIGSVDDYVHVTGVVVKRSNSK